MGQSSLLVTGRFQDDTTMQVLVAPLYIPLVIRLDSDPVRFGAPYTVTRQMNHLAPPFGCNPRVVRAISPPAITPGDSHWPIVPFVPPIPFGPGLNAVPPRVVP